jgi:hypothetical protein
MLQAGPLLQAAHAEMRLWQVRLRDGLLRCIAWALLDSWADCCMAASCCGHKSDSDKPAGVNLNTMLPVPT